MASVQHDIVIDQGSTFELALQWLDENETPIDLTGYTGRMQVRETHESADVLLDIPIGQVTLDASGNITITAPASDTAAVPEGRHVYDFEIYPAGDEDQAIRMIHGDAVVTPEVTR
jgi:hypothetical protein